MEADEIAAMTLNDQEGRENGSSDHRNRFVGQPRERWQRDRPLLQVAAKARAARAERAWERLTNRA